MGYVGLPLAVAFGKRYPTFGFDINHKRLNELRKGHDKTQELTAKQILEAEHLEFSTSIEALKNCNVYVITVPTPLDPHKQPDLTPLLHASKLVAGILARGML